MLHKLPIRKYMQGSPGRPQLTAQLSAVPRAGLQEEAVDGGGLQTADGESSQSGGQRVGSGGEVSDGRELSRLRRRPHFSHPTVDRALFTLRQGTAQFSALTRRRKFVPMDESS